MNRTTGNRLQLLIVIAIVLIMMSLYFMLITIQYQRKFKFIITRKKTITKVKKCPTPKIEIESFNQPRLVRIEKQNYSDSEAKFILLWTKYFHYNFSTDFYFFQEGFDTFKRYQCSFSQCFVTNNRSLFKEADAVLFHLWDISDDLPKFKYKKQKWILYTLESISTESSWKEKRNLFDWTMGYRSDSDVRVKYGEVCKLPKDEQISNVNEKDYHNGKEREIVWFVSNCHSVSNRMKYAKKLSKYIDIDVYGNCGSRKCEPSQSKQCYEDIFKKYKFYLSFENSICSEYVTEKFFNVLNYDIIPIVMGGANYDSIAPPHSFIDTRDFPNPKDLADYLKVVSQDSDLYNSYFDWKRKYKSYLYPWMCELCQKLHQKHETNVDRRENWWNSYTECEKWENDAFVKM
ncbi:glycoprotein 3-alpha-L-fucosyltransferase A-like [Centruroides sculpturatus]|uniref:glycoprotein 3-alpha-L-fucosyltransferase A-like n=1 Tax=Centruroides sculpturatus TaxID=218467 RepID=UPI000C6E16FA|nr:glycoprotein 3-alpha-L-fucosyltransferase A-like [Centruroides sculpturatus]XP_023215529.1 glycoprotein 3-alpha-L-fucosyltransferase A-like [Centruroides sculpturatus]XP_023215530.1 glycoprotein 3-alpha-L-fucosyltransferase A-like [Centruroides sculpturatus]